MENSPNFDHSSHAALKHLAEKSIGSSISVPAISHKTKNPFAEEKFKVTVDNRVNALYLQLLQNRINKLKKEELNEQRKHEFEEKLKKEMEKKRERKLNEVLEKQKIKTHREIMIDKIKEQIVKSRKEHDGLMDQIKRHTSQVNFNLNNKRKIEKMNHLRIKSMFLESSREANSQKASVIREHIKKNESARAQNWKKIQVELRKQYLAQLEQEKNEKSEFERKMKTLESEEAMLMAKLGKSHSTSVNSNC